MTQQVVSISNSLYKSLKGRYFVGQSEHLSFGNELMAWAGLINPIGSGINTFLSVFTMTNFADVPILAQVWINSDTPEQGNVSNLVSAANTAIFPPPFPKVELRFAEDIGELPMSGVNVFNRLIPPQSTVVDEWDGKFITPPGGSIRIYLIPQGTIELEARIVFGWWEEKVCSS